MLIHFELNRQPRQVNIQPGDILLETLRALGCWSVKHGCETGECGACSVLLDGRLVPSCICLTAQVDGHSILTLEGLSEGSQLHPIQAAFMDSGAIQCGYCTPGMILAARSLLDREANPSLEQAREALSPVLCRCTGYQKPVEAVLRAAAILRGEATPPVVGEGPLGLKTVGAPEKKVDALRLAKGRPSFTDDIAPQGMLYADMLTSPHAHARIRSIDCSKARALPGVHAVLTYQDIPRVVFAPGCQSYPNPKPYDQVSLDNKVRYIGDRVAVVAAETAAIARQALRLIEVEYEILPAVFDAESALQAGAPLLHDEPDAVGILDAGHNLVTKIQANIGDVEEGLRQADYRFERTYQLQQVQQTPIEPHVCITYWDEDDRMVIRTSTQAPYHLRRVIAPIIGLPVSRIRVIKPRIGGGFGGKMDVIVEDLAAHLTMITGRPVRFEYSREQEFVSSRSRHPARITYRAGVMKDGTLKALDMFVLENTGAYGIQGMTVCNLIGMRGLSTYRCENIRFDSQIVYTNLPVPGAFRGFGGPQGQFAMECLMDEIAAELGLDPVEFRLKNAVGVGDEVSIMKLLGEGGPVGQVIHSSTLPQCVEQAAAAIQWERQNDPAWRVDPQRPEIHRGLGMCLLMHGTAIPGLDMGGAILKMNDDGSFNLMIGAADLGTGSDTVLAQIAAETLGVPLSKVIVYSSDTDVTPFDVGAYASSTTFISGNAVKKAAEIVREKLFERAGMILNASPAEMAVGEDCITAADGCKVTLAEIATHSFHVTGQEQIMSSSSFMSMVSPPAFGAQFAEVEVNTITGEVRVVKLALAVDCGTVINPQTAVSQMEGGMAQALGYAVSEEMAYDDHGSLLTRRFGDYRIFQADEMPEMISILVPSYEESGPYGAKGLGEITAEGVAPAVANAVFAAAGVRIRSLPVLPEKVWQALCEKGGPEEKDRLAPNPPFVQT